MPQRVSKRPYKIVLMQSYNSDFRLSEQWAENQWKIEISIFFLSEKRAEKRYFISRYYVIHIELTQ